MEEQIYSGSVRFYSSRGFGFIDGDGPDGPATGQTFYFHIRGVKGGRILHQGERVSFRAIPNPKGPQAVDIQPIQSTSLVTPTVPSGESDVQ